MSLPKLSSLFLLAVSVVGFATVGTLNVQIKEYEVPTPKSRPHDPAIRARRLSLVHRPRGE